MLTPRFSAAVSFAVTAHGDQCRKGGNIPYVSHLLAVAGLVLEHGGSEDEAIAGLLHDVLEDVGEELATDIEAQFGTAVLEIVSACSDSIEGLDRGAASWRQRKELYLTNLPNKSPSALLVTACDKLHNARSLLSDFYQIGFSVFDRFNAGMDATLWYQQSIASALRQYYPSPVSDELARVVDELIQQVQMGSV
ncbi:HD domain-containing protein [Leeia sp. TBRC 13508]|uniref:HD domain-containing protein n=1 Tax=Leeia speluncae TaxID=2884804 RepID=A0ABS8D458_9NEIS|nr:HD domain-containing protein [Leeia speluncae]MCB6182977.1 HD domain-containing protein [Leeia speluncae]